MVTFDKLIICNEDDENATSLQSISEFQLEIEPVDKMGLSEKECLDNVVFNLIRHPKALNIHLQRIYFCYQHDFSEDLFAALVDFLIILDGKGENLSRRMIQGSKSKLSAKNFSSLVKALENTENYAQILTGNMYSVFSQGLIGTNILIKKQVIETVSEHDPLDIARDYIAYSQLDTAMETLEDAILVDFSRQILHDDLLELYRLTNNPDRFEKMYDSLSKQFENMPVGWDELKGFFNDR